jgi:RsiW-degrading membrane proteinase PrsW (M82 family)
MWDAIGKFLQYLDENTTAFLVVIAVILIIIIASRCYIEQKRPWNKPGSRGGRK